MKKKVVLLGDSITQGLGSKKSILLKSYKNSWAMDI